MDFYYEMNLILLKSTKQILGFSPAANFIAPSNVSVVTPKGVRHFLPADWEIVLWMGKAPKGLTAQTCFLYEYVGNGKIQEINKPAWLEQVVI
ncbi:MAG: hypothetical protein RLZZ535_2755 [Cyanobacteriota bacterium]|jgi:hypothetical protein